MRKALDRLERILDGITAAMIVMLTLLVSWQVFSRYVLNSSQFWAEETAVISLIWIGMLGAAGSIWSESHIGLTFFVDRLPQAVRVWVKALNDFLIAAFSAFLCYHGWLLVQRTMGGTWSSVPIPIGYSYLIVPISAVFFTLFAVARGTMRLAEHYSR